MVGAGGGMTDDEYNDDDDDDDEEEEDGDKADDEADVDTGTGDTDIVDIVCDKPEDDSVVADETIPPDTKGDVNDGDDDVMASRRRVRGDSDDIDADDNTGASTTTDSESCDVMSIGSLMSVASVMSDVSESVPRESVECRTGLKKDAGLDVVETLGTR